MQHTKIGKWGAINQDGNEVIAVNYEEMVIVPDNTKDIFIITTDVNYEAGTYKTIAQNSKGEKLFTSYETVEAIDNFDDNGNVWYEECLKVKKDGKYGLINFKGELILDCKYDNIESIKGITNSLIIEKNGKVGIASNVGSVIAEAKYAKAMPLTSKYSDGFIVTTEEGKSGIVGNNKKIILEAVYDEIKQVSSDELYVVVQDGTLKVVDKEENVVIDGGYDEFAQIYGDTIIVAKKGDKYGAINKNGEEKIPFEYQELKYVLNKYYIAKKDDKYGVLDTENNQMLPFEYTYIQNRTDTDFLEVEKDQVQTEVYNNEMKLVLSGILSEVNTEKGYIILRKDGDWKFYNFKFEEKQEKDIFPEHTLFLSKKDGKYGYTNKDGDVIVDYIYDDAKLQNSCGYCVVKKGNTWGSINKDGNLSQEPNVSLEDYLVIDFIGKWHYGKELEMNYYTY